MTLIKSRLARRLTVWLLLLSLLPLVVIAVFVLNNVDTALDEVSLSHHRLEAQILASMIGRYPSNDVAAVLRADPLLRESVTTVNSGGMYQYHPNSQVGFLSDDLPTGVVSQILGGSPGATVLNDGTIVGYAPITDSSDIVLIKLAESPNTALKSAIRRTTQIQVGASLLIMSIVAGIAIWIVVGKPVGRLTEAAERVGRGVLSPDVDLDDMTDELQVLGSAFNKMMHDLQRLIDGLAGKVSELQEVQKALAASEEHFRALVEHAQDIIAVLNADGSIRFISPAVERILGFGQDEVIGRKAIDLIDPDDHPNIEAAELLETRTPRTVVLRARRKDGTFRDLETAAHNLLDATELNGIVINARDITDRRRLEAQVGQAQKMEAIGRLAGGIAHDFNNLLMPIIGYVELVKADTEPGTETHIAMQHVQEAANRATDLTRQILGFSRGQVIEVQTLNLNGIVDEFSSMIRHLIGEDIDFESILFPDLYYINADRGQIEQLLMNLAINARDAMPIGGKLTIETSNAYLDETYISHYSQTLTPGPYAMVAVTDNGQGMDEETQRQIFEPFYTTKTLGEGTGLGLSTTFSIVRQHGGNIWVYSEPGSGTTFKIYLPRAADGEHVEAKSPSAAPKLYGDETILVVEDEEMVRRIVCESLRAHGYTVIEAAGPAEGLDIASGRNDPIHLLLTDVIMPGMDGRELSEKILEIQPEAQVLFMSGYTDNVIVHHGVLDDGVNYLQKPFTVQELTVKIRKLLENAEKPVD